MGEYTQHTERVTDVMGEEAIIHAARVSGAIHYTPAVWGDDGDEAHAFVLPCRPNVFVMVHPDDVSDHGCVTVRAYRTAERVTADVILATLAADTHPDAILSDPTFGNTMPADIAYHITAASRMAEVRAELDAGKH